MSEDFCEPSGQERRDSIVFRWILDGESLTEAEIENFEQSLKSHPDNLETRCRLIGNYFLRQFEPGIGQRRLAHLIWIHENHPDLEIVGTPYCAPTPEDSESATRLDEIWRARVAANPEDPTVLAQAARYFRNSDDTVSVGLYEKLKTLRPNETEWYSALGRHYLLKARMEVGDGKTEVPAARRALTEYLAAEQRTPDEERFYLLDDIAWSALYAEDPATAAAYADRLLEMAASRESSWNYGNAIHCGHTILGLLALADNRIDEAGQHLKASGNHKGSPQLRSFGPGTELAAALLAAGEKEAVLEFLDDCGKYWRMGADRLRRWKEELEETGETEFQRFYPPEDDA